MQWCRQHTSITASIEWPGDREWRMGLIFKRGLTLKLKHIGESVIDYSKAEVWVDVELKPGVVETTKFHLLKEDKTWYMWDFDR